jgi:hypothetical protein
MLLLMSMMAILLSPMLVNMFDIIFFFYLELNVHFVGIKLEKKVVISR